MRKSFGRYLFERMSTDEPRFQRGTSVAPENDRNGTPRVNHAIGVITFENCYKPSRIVGGGQKDVPTIIRLVPISIRAQNNET